ncbi:MAG: ribose-phosphate diphosphokinase [Chitinivibrionales bacterium]|nr:ribose-phosphate diphosphokinase [Chitinivibrionales bacterium]MBD3394460.1 ribose-phosphate diphosphokinase [Chitinivibrionales bacterium]
MSGTLKIFSGNANPELSRAICREAGVRPGKCEIVKFSNENIKVNIQESVRGKDVFVIQPSCPPVNEGIMELLIMIDAIKHASADRITAVVPYFPYARSDKKDEPRISITARLIADLLQTAGANRVMTMNLHSPQIQGFFRIPVDHLLAGSLLCDFFANDDLHNSVVVAPDAGSAKHAGRYAISLQVPLAILDKRREDDNEAPVIHNVIGDVAGKNVIIFDDEIASGGSIIEVVNALESLGVEHITACCVHGVLSGNAVHRIDNSSIRRLVVTDTVRIPPEKRIPKLTVVSVAELFAKAILHTHRGKSISGLYLRY